jgi:eukaryotic-like serine/threonine-protein kinase
MAGNPMSTLLPAPFHDDYELLFLLGEGSMGSVYLAEHRVHGYRVAIKRLHEHLADNEEVVTRFLAEARAAAKVHHPGIVDVFEAGQDDGGIAYLIMDHLEGESLGERLTGGTITAWEAVDLGCQIAGTLAAAHRAGIVHRDLKPDNIFLVRDPVALNRERVKLLDFGVAKFLDDHRTRCDLVFGTPFYMAPEQCRAAANAGPESDVYALGCILYEMLAGKVPFEGEVDEILVAHQHSFPRPPSALEPSIPRPLEALILRMMAKRPEDRPRSMCTVVAELTSALPEVLAPAA